MEPAWDDSDRRDLDQLVYEGASSLLADFVTLNGQGAALRVRFERTEIIRVLDEMPLSTEEVGRPIGVVPHNFAYRVLGSAFWEAQSSVFRETYPNLKHFQFFTGNTCLDVIAECEPTFQLVPRRV